MWNYQSNCAFEIALFWVCAVFIYIEWKHDLYHVLSVICWPNVGQEPGPRNVVKMQISNVCSSCTDAPGTQWFIPVHLFSLYQYITTSVYPFIIEGGGLWTLIFFYNWIPLCIGLKNKVQFCHGHFLRPVLHYWSKYQIASNDFKFCIHLVHRIQRPMGKRWAQLDRRFNSYSVFFGVFWAIFEKSVGPFEFIFSP